MRSVLFVCTGNICRSPIAEAIGRKMAVDRGTEVVFDSAGVSPEERGNSLDPRAARILIARGYTVPDRMARQVTSEDFTDFGWIVGMTRRHEAALRRAAPEISSARIRLFSTFLKNPTDPDIADPWYGGGPDFVAVMDLLEAGMPRLLDAVAQR